MPKVKKTKTPWKHQALTPPESPEEPSVIPLPSLPKVMMNSFLQGPIITHLAPNTEYDPTTISHYITSVLEEVNQDNAYGILAGVTEDGGPVVPTLIFGIPSPNLLPLTLPSTPFQLPILMKQDAIMAITVFDTVWDKDPVYGTDQIELAPLSVGVEGCLDNAGSFGGFLRKPSMPDMLFGITAAHCLPETGQMTNVCSPSSAEITGRLHRILPYTTLQKKDLEARSMLEQYHFTDTGSGVTILDPTEDFQRKTGVFHGRHVGRVIASGFGDQQGLLHSYDKWLGENGHNKFIADPTWNTRMDWSIFSCDPTRFAGNIYDEITITSIGALYPGVQVEKIGRTTGVTEGHVNGFLLQRWVGAKATYEIAITGDKGLPFAAVGDSGGCVLVKANNQYLAGGILIGINTGNNFAIVTPFHLILAAVPEYVWA
ncbi:hypothetical protein B9Z19DRAFT_1063615 [Tuber borchii]|uniref:Uncharacterized protein n=1 Tax=Tuber borchii TaxID=42251 RepID=A0A2T6ZXK3_TUBBO|nr:hypothetical protein B9Z19DRAFT_1063615 [Tuber borchii]